MINIPSILFWIMIIIFIVYVSHCNTKISPSFLPENFDINRWRKRKAFQWMLLSYIPLLLVFIYNERYRCSHRVLITSYIAAMGISFILYSFFEGIFNRRLKSIIRAKLINDGVEENTFIHGSFVSILTDNRKPGLGYIDIAEDVGFLVIDIDKIVLYGALYRIEIEKDWITSITRHRVLRDTSSWWGVKIISVSYTEPNGKENTVKLIVRGGITVLTYRTAGNTLWDILKIWQENKSCQVTHETENTPDNTGDNFMLATLGKFNLKEIITEYVVFAGVFIVMVFTGVICPAEGGLVLLSFFLFIVGLLFIFYHFGVLMSMRKEPEFKLVSLTIGKGTTVEVTTREKFTGFWVIRLFTICMVVMLCHIYIAFLIIDLMIFYFHIALPVVAFTGILAVLSIYIFIDWYSGNRDGEILMKPEDFNENESFLVEISLIPRLKVRFPATLDTADDIGILSIEGDLLKFEGDGFNMSLNVKDVYAVEAKRRLECFINPGIEIKLNHSVFNRLKLRIGLREGWHIFRTHKRGKQMRQTLIDWHKNK